MDLPCVCISLRKATRRLTGRYDQALAPVGINVAQFSLLRNIGQHGPISLTALGEVCELDRSTLGRNVKVLMRLGLVDAIEGADKRESSVALSEQGIRSLDQAIPLWSGVQDTVYGKLGAEGATQLQALLGAL